MQLLPPLSSDPRAFRRETPAGTRLPYACHVDGHSILTRDGMLMQMLHVRGLLFETAESAEINYRNALREAMLRNIGNARFAVYHHIVRRSIHVALDGRFPDDFSARIDRNWRARLASRRLYVNDLFITLVRRPLPGRIGLVDRAAGLIAGRRADAGVDAAELRHLDTAATAMQASLAHYGARRLGVYMTPGGPCSEPIELLSLLYNGEMRPMLMPEGDLGHHIPYRRISFGEQTIEFAPAGTLPREFAGIVAIKDYPAQTMPGMFDQLMRLPMEFTVSQSFGFVDRQAALGRIGLAMRRMRAADDEAASLRAELAEAQDEVSAGRAAFGEHHLAILVRADTPAAVDTQIAEVQAALADLGVVSVREDIALEASFWSQFPGNFKYIARRALVSARNFSSLASLHNFPVGTAQENHWGQAVTLFETTAAGPYHFNFHNGDLGNFTVIGPSGSGKTVVVNFLLAQARKFRPRLIFFDKDRGAEIFIRAIGGRYDLLRPGTASGLNPLRLPDSPENRRFLAAWVARLVSINDGGPSTEDAAHIKEAVDANFDQAPRYRQLRYFADLFRGGRRPDAADLAARLKPWWGEGEHAWLFDNADDLIDLDAETIGFDMTRILDDPALRSAAMMYLFHRVEERLDGSPAIIVIDEGWKALDDDVFVQRIRDWEKTIRKRNGIVGFVTQSAEDALQSRIAAAIIEQAATQIFMSNPKAQREDYCTGFGLSEHEYDLVRSLPDDARCFLIKHGAESVVARLDLDGERDVLTVLSGREHTVRRLDEIRRTSGDDPAAWLPRLLAEA